jgi:hypothetical protein
MYPTAGPALVFTQRRTARTFAGQVVWHPQLTELPPKGLAIVRIAPSVALGTVGAPIASYAEEARLLKDPKKGEPRTEGRRLHAYGRYKIDGYAFTPGIGTSRRSYDSLHHPLTYRSLNRLRQTEASRFVKHLGSHYWDDLLGVQVGTTLPGLDASRADELLIPLAGTVADALTHRRRPPSSSGWQQMVPPFESYVAGAGLLATFDPEGASDKGRLVGLVSGDGVLHMRLSAHWPLVHRVLIEQGLASDAEHLARQVLNLQPFANDRCGKPGQLYGQENPSTLAFEFFRLRHVEADGTYPALPSHGQSDRWWEFLGTDLPTRAKVMKMQKEDREAAKRAAQAVTPLPGTDPALPAL